MLTLIKKHLSHDAHPLVQFIKYGIAGGIATAANLVILYALAAWAWPCLTEGDAVRSFLHLPVAEALAPAARATRAFLCNVPAFLVSNGVAYVMNILFVFKPGRHHWAVEVALFYVVSGVSFGVGVSIQSLLIRYLGLTTSAAFGANIISALLINYAMRKFVIFKG